MKKTFTFFLGMVLSMVLSSNVMAQDAPDLTGWHLDQPLIKSVSQLFTLDGDAAEGKDIGVILDGDNTTFWHANWHGDSPRTWPYCFDVSVSEPLDGYYGMKMARRHNDDNNHVILLRIYEEVEGLGWMKVTDLPIEFNGRGSIEYPAPFRLTGTKKFRFEAVQTNNGGQTWHLAEFQLYPVDMEVCAQDYLMPTYEYYSSLPAMETGTGIGQYDEAACNKFQSDLDQAGVWVSTEEIPDAETVDAWTKGIIEDHRNALRSMVPFSFTDGYYRIKSALPYKQQVETGETDLDGNPVTTTETVAKAMYGTLENRTRWATYDAKDCRQVWKLTNVGELVKMQNAGTDGYITNKVDNGMVLAEEGDLVKFTYMGNNTYGNNVIVIRCEAQETNASGFFHQNGHGKGTGTEGMVGTWKNTYDMGVEYDSDKGTSEWYLEPVSDEEAQALIEAFEPIKNHDKLVLNYKETIAKAKTAIDFAQDLRGTYETNNDAPVIQETSWFHSVSSDESEGSLNNLLDGNPGTFWHSNWHDGDHGAHYHSLDICFPEAITGWYETYIIRRSGQNNNNWVETSLYGTNDENLLNQVEDTGWELICKTVSTPYTNGQYDQYSQPFEVTKAYKYWRFYEDVTGSNATYGNCGHLGDFQIYPATKVRASQWDHVGEVGQTLLALVEAYPTFDVENVTIEQYNTLMDAYNAFMELIVDPAELNAALAAAQKELTKMYISNDPGCYSDESKADGLLAAIADAQAYVDAAKFTKQGVADMIANLQKQTADFDAASNPIRTDMWYTIGFHSAEVFAEQGFDPGITKPNLYGSVMVPGYRDAEGNAIANDTPGEGSSMFFVTDYGPEDQVAQFRFVKINDDLYAIQHRTSGLFVGRRWIKFSQGDGVELSMTPVAFSITKQGLGMFLMNMTRLQDDQNWEHYNLNAWYNAGGSLVAAWAENSYGGDSSLLIHEAEPVNPDDIEFNFAKDIHVGEVSAFCYPSNVTIESNGPAVAYTAAGCFAEGEDKFLALAEVELEVEAGVPFVVICGEEVNPNGGVVEEQTCQLYLQNGDKIAKTPKSKGGLVGSYLERTVPEGSICFLQETDPETGVTTNKMALSNGNIHLDENNAVIYYTEEEVGDYTIALGLDGNIKDHTDDAIQSALANVAKPGNVYNAAGQLVRKNATLNDVKALGRGLYILNGTKVMVK